MSIIKAVTKSVMTISFCRINRIDMKTGKVIEFVDEEIEALQAAIARKLGYRLIDHRLELYGVPMDEQDA